MSDPRALLDAYANEFRYYLPMSPLSPEGARGPAKSREDVAPKAFAALRAVLDQHPARKFETWSACDGCTDGDHLVTWPCPTVEAIWTTLEQA